MDDNQIPAGTSIAIVQAVHAAQAGNTEAVGTLYATYVDTVFRYIYYRVSTWALAEDLTSETFVRALRRITTFSWQGRDFGAWLVTIARNLIADHYRSSRARRTTPVGDEMELDSSEAEADPGFIVGEETRNRAIRAALDRLVGAQRQCIELRFFNGLSVAETAAAMGKTEGAIKALQSRTLGALRRGNELEGWFYDA